MNCQYNMEWKPTGTKHEKLGHAASEIEVGKINE